ncbi:glucan biosynthesis protein [Roseinatronobacter monicus]|uniref:Glucans biosynthesis protein n=1 Tax=Roseinatronobacter monicus TaxID=393481 RepID=A0A543KG09_9RHOB|nr:glucan biosynthesis protein [Roseinatronobacter monicus]TQM94021.1 glucans biosynthesis protein [Roseinatronobacter monicus]
MMTRRALLAMSAAMLPSLTLGLRPAKATASDLSHPEGVIAAARALAQSPYQPQGGTLAPPFDGLDYDSYRGVTPKEGKAAALALGDNYRADLLPPGWLFPDPVSVDLPGHDIDFSADLFAFDERLVTPPDAPVDYSDMGFSGLRLRTRLNAPDRWDDVLVLQGASYFRALAQDTVYGLSARALSLGTGGTAPEEFPVTRHISVFAADADLSFGCLIDSPRASAALIATLRPGRETVMDCALHLFARQEIPDAGIAPLTSMFQHNDLGPARIDDFRPAVHDSDVLVIDNGAGERLWRPLANPAAVQVSAFADEGVRGFGLLQAPVEFERYRDAEAAYHRRPSGWVTPQGDWGQGAVMLLEIPTENEFADNIVAFWRPAAPLAPGAHRFDYRLSWLAPATVNLPAAPQDFALTPVHSASGVEPNARQGRLFVVDFQLDPAAQADIGELAGALVLDMTSGSGAEMGDAAIYPLAGATDVLRTSFLLTPEADTASAELRLQLRDSAGAAVSPVWLYRWTRTSEGGI